MATAYRSITITNVSSSLVRIKRLPYGKASAMAKLMAGDTAMNVTTEAVQVFGGYGYTKDYPVERLYA